MADRLDTDVAKGNIAKIGESEDARKLIDETLATLKRKQVNKRGEEQRVKAAVLTHSLA